MRARFRSDPGYTLVEVLVGFALIASATAALGGMVSRVYGSRRALVLRTDARDFNSELINLLSNPSNCTANLKGTVIGPAPGSQTDVPSLSYAQGSGAAAVTTTPFVSPGKSYPDQNGVQINSLTLVTRSKVGDLLPPVTQTPPAPTNRANFAFQLVVKLTRKGEVAGTRDLQVMAPVRALVDTATNTILSCGQPNDNLTPNLFCQLTSGGITTFVPDPTGTGGACGQNCYNSLGTTDPTTGSATQSACPAGQVLGGQACRAVGGSDPAVFSHVAIQSYGLPPGVNINIGAGPPAPGAPVLGPNQVLVVTNFANQMVDPGNPNGCLCDWAPDAVPGVCLACCGQFNLTGTQP